MSRKKEPLQERIRKQRDRTPKEAGLVPKGDHVAKGTLDVNES